MSLGNRRYQISRACESDRGRKATSEYRHDLTLQSERRQRHVGFVESCRPAEDIERVCQSGRVSEPAGELDRSLCLGERGRSEAPRLEKRKPCL